MVLFGCRGDKILRFSSHQNQVKDSAAITCHFHLFLPIAIATQSISNCCVFVIISRWTVSIQPIYHDSTSFTVSGPFCVWRPRRCTSNSIVCRRSPLSTVVGVVIIVILLIHLPCLQPHKECSRRRWSASTIRHDIYHLRGSNGRRSAAPCVPGSHYEDGIG